MSEWDNKYGQQAKMKQSSKPYIQKGCSQFLFVLAIIIWVGGFFVPLMMEGGDTLLIIVWFSALVSGGLVMGLSDVIRLLGQIEYNTRVNSMIPQNNNNQPQIVNLYQQNQ